MVLLYESVNFQLDKVLKEEAERIQTTAIAAYKVPISIADQENLNGRIYTAELWERVVKEYNDSKRVDIGLMDHPLGAAPGSYKDVFTIWKNLSYDAATKKVWAEMHLIGPYGELVNNILQQGAPVGMSSVGTGDLDGNMVVASTYRLIRPADAVLFPSQRIYAQIDSKDRPPATNQNKEEQVMRLGESVYLIIKGTELFHESGPRNFGFEREFFKAKE